MPSGSDRQTDNKSGSVVLCLKEDIHELFYYRRNS